MAYSDNFVDRDLCIFTSSIYWCLAPVGGDFGATISHRIISWGYTKYVVYYFLRAGSGVAWDFFSVIERLWRGPRAATVGVVLKGAVAVLSIWLSGSGLCRPGI